MGMKLFCLLLLTLLPIIVPGLGHRDFHPKIVNRHHRDADEQCDLEETVDTDEDPIKETDYWPDSDCTWIVTAPKDSVILLVSDLFDLQPCSNCSCDYVELFDGEHRSSESAGKFCGQKSVRFISNTEKLFVHFRSDDTAIDEFKGFSFSLSFLTKASDKVCNVMSAEEKQIVLPLNNQGRQSHSGMCLYRIQAPVSKRVKLKLTDFVLDNALCSNDTFNVYDGKSSASDELGWFCGHGAPLSITSSSNSLFLSFNTSEMVSSKKLTLTYTFVEDKGSGSNVIYPKPVQTCSSSTPFETALTASDDVIVGANYPSMADCLWKITAPEHRQILLVSNYFDLEECNKKTSCDNVRLFDGQLGRKSMVGKFTGRKNLRFISQTNILNIHFTSNDAVSGQGFHFKISFIPQTSTCNRTSNETSGTISSPNYPAEYPNSLRCFYRIQAPDKKKVKLEFRDFKLESRHFGNCTDVLTVYDGKSSVSNKIGTFCGDEAPLSITSSGSGLFLHFHTDQSVRGTGFSLTYTFVDGNNTSPISDYPDTVPKYKPPVPCVNTTLNTSVVFEYGWFEEGYPHNANCLWTITAPPDNRILLMSNYTTLEFSHDCKFDFVELFDGKFQASASVGKFCGRTEVRLMSHTNTVFIHFRSDDTVSGHGFEFNVSFLPAPSSTACNRITQRESGVISSSNYPHFYPNNARCLHSIQAPENKRVKLEFKDFVLERGPCSDDYLTVYDGKSSASSELGTFCGRRIPVTITSSSNTLLLYFHTNDFIKEKGFNLAYTFVDVGSGDGHAIYGETPSKYDPDCSSTVTTENTNLTSPHVRDEEFYRPRKICRTNIRAPEGQGVELRFLAFDLEESLDCQFDHINITYLSQQGDWTTVRLCGYQRLSTLCFHSFENNLILDFRSDDSFEGTGYEADFSFVASDEISTCNTTLCGDDCQGYCYNRGEGFHCACPNGNVPPDCTQNITWIKPLGENVTVTEGDELTVSCKVNHPHTTTGWDKGIGDETELIFANQRVTVGPELMIRDVVMDDSGMYTCIVLAGDRTLTQTIRLIVQN